MRRRLGTFIPLVLIAIWVQIFAPIGAYWAMAAAADPFGSAPICAPSIVGKSGQTQPGGQQPAHMDCCSLCVVAHAGSAPLQSPEPIVASIDLSFTRLTWIDRQIEQPSRLRSAHAQARAPPFHS